MEQISRERKRERVLHLLSIRFSFFFFYEHVYILQYKWKNLFNPLISFENPSNVLAMVNFALLDLFL